jgi:hypothetical protein
MIYRKKRTTRIALTSVISFPLFFIAASLIQTNKYVKTIGEVFPKDKWVLTRGNGGQIISNLVDYSKNHSAEFNVSQFERGEFVKADFNKYLKEKKNILKGDTIVCLGSSDLLDQIVTAAGEFEIAVANFKSQSTPEKQALIDEAKSRLNYNNEKHTEQKILYERTKKLFEKGFCSQQEYEAQKWNLDLLEIEKKTCQAQIDNLTTGVKEEEKNLLEQKIEAAKERVNFLKGRESQMVLCSPIGGEIIPSFSPDTLLNVVNFNDVVLHLPVKLTDIQEFHEGDQIKMFFTNFNNVENGRILSIAKEVKLINYQQVVFLAVLINNKEHKFIPGMLVDISIVENEIPYLKYIYNILNN